MSNISERVEAWFCNGIPAEGLIAWERSDVIEDATSSFLAEHVGQSEANLRALTDKDLVAVHYWAMHEATR